MTDTLVEVPHTNALVNLQERINEEVKRRQLLTDYFKSQMQANKHYYSLTPEGGRSGRSDVPHKAVLSKEGALNLASLFKARPVFESPEIIKTDNPLDVSAPHITVSYKCALVDEMERVIAEGVGVCSTLETKYRYRWAFGNEVPDDIDKASLPKKEVGQSRKYVKYRLEHSNPSDFYNTVYKMAKKRALVDAALQLPLVSELFTQDIGDPEEGEIAAVVPSKVISVKTIESNSEVVEPEPEDLREVGRTKALYLEFYRKLPSDKRKAVEEYVADNPNNEMRALKKALIQYGVSTSSETFKRNYESRHKVTLDVNAPADVIADFLKEAEADVPF
jgi:hypothetical protein